MENTYNKLILLSIIFFKNIIISFFDLVTNLFSINPKEINQITNNIVCAVARHVLSFTVHPLQAVSVFLSILLENKKKLSFPARLSRIYSFL